MAEKTLPTVEFDASPEQVETDIKLFIGVAGASAAFDYEKPVTPTISNSVEACRTAMTTAGFKEFGALEEAIKSERKEGKTKTNYKSSKANELTFNLVNCTVVNIKAADALDGERIDVMQLDEANATLKIWKNMKVAVTETDENTKSNKISFKLTNDTCSPTSRVFTNLLTGTSTDTV